MDDRKNINASGAAHRFIMNDHDQKEHSGIGNDLLNRRMKNRERQRRYRARKRLEAELKKTSVPNQLAPLQIEQEPSGNNNNCVARVPCKRNWKKDARRAAHASKNLEGTINGAFVSPTTSSAGNQTTCSPSGVTGEPSVERNSHSENSPHLPSDTNHQNKSRRDWKAEARNKKN